MTLAIRRAVPAHAVEIATCLDALGYGTQAVLVPRRGSRAGRGGRGMGLAGRRTPGRGDERPDIHGDTLNRLYKAQRGDFVVMPELARLLEAR